AMPESYQRLLLDCMVGDQTLFTRFDGVQIAWELLDPVLDAWQNGKVPLAEYPAGSDSFSEADAIVAADGRQWRKLTAK
ncbi:MAG: glucose-6-phosphate dehydrogenase, partial [Phycisphaerales bacterium]